MKSSSELTERYSSKDWKSPAFRSTTKVVPPFCILAGNTSDGDGSLGMNGTTVSNGTRPSPINISHRSFRNFPESFGKWKTPCISTFTRGSRNIFPWPLVKKGIRSHLRTVKVSQTRILIKMVVTWRYVRDTELNMACLGYQVENVRTLFMEITRASQKGEQAASEMSKEIMSKWSTFVPVGAGKGGIYICLPCFKTSWRPLGWNLKSGS